MNLEKNPILYSGIRQIMNRGTAEVLEETENSIFVRDTVSEAYIAATDTADQAIEWLMIYEKPGKPYGLLNLYQSEAADFAEKRYGLKKMACLQAVYEGTEPPQTEGSAPGKIFRIDTATEADFDAIWDLYKMNTAEELQQVIKRGNLYIAQIDGKLAGFAGQHLEGSMGMLQVLPEYRGRGLATELEAFMIGRMLEQGLIPLCQVEPDNAASMHLQRKLGLTISEEMMWWMLGQ